METIIIHIICQAFNGSYPTYEEWKHPNKTEFKELKGGSYPTYEEWKQILKDFVSNSSPVLILPMRNGNSAKTEIITNFIPCSYPTYEEWKHDFYFFSSKSTITVLILPMRNGNKIERGDSQMIVRVLILPMRNGNVFTI